jgi:hypothetical protein
MRKYFISIFIAFLLYFNISCTKKNDTASIATGQFFLHLHTNIDTAEVDGYNTVIVSQSKRKISLSIAQLYISNIQLLKIDGSVYPVTGKVLLKVLVNEGYLVGNVPAGNYKSVSFSVGLNSTENNTAPLTSDTVFYHPEIWFGNSAQPEGFVFLNFEGKIDTTTKANGSESQLQPFVYKIRTVSNLSNVSMPEQKFTVLPNQPEYVHIIINYFKIFNGIDLSQPGNLSVQNPSDNSNTVVKQIVTNIPGMFAYEGMGM